MGRKLYFEELPTSCRIGVETGSGSSGGGASREKLK